MDHQSERSEAGVESRVRLIDVAELAAVSRGVAGQVLNGGKGNSRVSEATIERILNAAEKLNYRPNLAAQQLKGVSARMFGMLVASAGDPLRSFLVQYLDTKAVKSGYHTIIGNTLCDDGLGPDQFNYHVDELARRGVDGVFCAVHDWIQGDRARLVNLHPNTVFYEDHAVPGAPVVKANRYIAARLAVRHLLERGRRRIGVIVSDAKKATSQERLRGFGDEHEAYGEVADKALVYDAALAAGDYVRHDSQTMAWTFPEKHVDEAVDQLVGRGGADAIVCCDDFWAAMLLRRLRARGIGVPGHVAVVGYLNHYLADWTDPPLTTIDTRQDIAAEQILRMMEVLVSNGSLAEEDRIVEITPKLIVRHST